MPKKLPPLKIPSDPFAGGAWVKVGKRLPVREARRLNLEWMTEFVHKSGDGLCLLFRPAAEDPTFTRFISVEKLQVAG